MANIETLLSQFSSLDKLAESTAKGLYANRFESHIHRLMTIDLSAHREPRQIPIEGMSLRRYIGMEQTAFESSQVYEGRDPIEPNWDQLDESRARTTHKLRELVENGESPGMLMPFVERTVDTIENYLSYELMYPDSTINPWWPTFQIIKNGLLLFLSDNHRQLKEFHVKHEATDHNLGVVVKGESRRFGGYVLDNRYAAQTVVFKFLSREARGTQNAISLPNILRHLRQKGFDFANETNVQIMVTTPLKKTGLIGSTINGFFFIESADDLKAAYHFHYVKSKSILRVMERYKQRQKEFGDLDLDQEMESE